jgi:hypothetical protein
MRQLTLSKGPAKMRIRYHGQGTYIPSKGFLSHDRFMHALDIQ